MLNFQRIKRDIKKKNFNPKFERDILTFLDEKKHYLRKLALNFNKKRNLEYFTHLKQRFPLFNDHITNLKRFEDYPNIVQCILITLIIEKKMPYFYKILNKRIQHLSSYLNGRDDRKGKKEFEHLVARRKSPSKKLLIKYLKDSIRNVKFELSDYKNEAEAYEQRNIQQYGLITNDAVKCLKDFEGRTFPFLRAICLQIKTNDYVLEVGVGTGVLSIAAVIAGARKVVGIEINPITCILADIIVHYLEENKIIPKKSIDILWGDALQFSVKEHPEFRGKKFDALINENIYTGMFFELQMKMVTHILENNLLRCKKELGHTGFYTLVTKSPVIPEGLASCLELVELNRPINNITEILLDLRKRNIFSKTLTKDHVYDQISFDGVEQPDVISRIKFRILKNGKINALNFYSTIRMMEGDYIDRGENDFLNNDAILILNKSIQVKKGDIIMVGLAYNAADSIKDIVIELRKMNKDGSVNKKYDARLNISEAKHRRNIQRFTKKNNCKQPLNLKDLGDFEIVNSASFIKGYERIWLADIDYMNLKAYGV